jgi:LPS export ABC transporter permease LptG
MILSDLARHVTFVVAGMTLIFLIFTVFELVGEIVQNRVPAGVVVGYLLYLAPQIMTYMAPLAVLVGVMVTFGLMASGSQVVALKASGQSIYRMAVPVFCLAVGVSAGLFAIQNYVLPTTNRQQEDLRQQIRSGKEPPRTIYQVDRQWIFGKSNRIYYYRHYDPTSDSFADLSVFDLDPETFQITRRIWASKAKWEPENGTWLLEFGWVRTFDGTRITSGDAFRQQRIQLSESPEYFKRPVSEADKLNYAELRRQIDELSASGLDVLDLRIDLQGKLAFPLTCLVMALVGLPFAFSVGKRGALYGVAVGLAIGLVFWGALGLFTQMGRYEILPPVLAAWGPNLLFGAGGAYMFLTTRT